MIEKDEIKFSRKPTKDQLNQIEKWLIEEKNSTGDGFYCNWSIITSAYEEKELAIILEGKQTIGFIAWDASKFTAMIVIVEIKPTHRNRGLGKYLISKLIEQLISENVCVVKLEYSSRKSELFFRNLGFVNFPEGHNSRYCELYKIVVPHLEVHQDNDNDIDEFVELWNDDFCDAQKLKATWKWQLSFKDGTRELEKPIIHPCHYDWRMRWTNGSTTIEDKKVKYFGQGEIYFGGFLIIKEMPQVPSNNPQIAK